MNVGFLGLGKLGLPVALAIEKRGHSVIACDTSTIVREIVATRECPYKEEGIQQLLSTSAISLCDIKALVETCEIVFIAVQTPHHPEYEGITTLPQERVDFDYSFLSKAVDQLSFELSRQGRDIPVLVVSTVLPGTIDTLIKPLLPRRVKLCYNPFFIAMGTAIRDFLFPEFVLIGTEREEDASAALSFYGSVCKAPIHTTSIRNAELIKVAYNTFISTKIAFANTLMEIAHKVGADVDDVTGALSRATKRLISPSYMSGGMGDGGACHPRDNIAMSYLARNLRLSYDWFEGIMRARELQTMWLADLMESHDLPKVILGKAFKAGSNLTDGSPSILLCNILRERGHQVRMYDPLVDQQRPQFPPSVFLIGTKHPEFEGFEFPLGSVVIDPWRYIADREGVSVIRIGQI